MRKFDITSFGEILIDFTYVKYSISGKKLFEQNPGGAPANVLVSATKLGATTAFIGKAGNDMHGEFLRDTLLNENINIDNFILDDDYFTTLAFVDLNENNERSFSFARKPGADTQMKMEDLNVEIIKSSKIFHVGSLSLTDDPSRETTHYAIKVARSNGVIVSYDPNYRASLWESEEDAVKHMNSIIPDVMKISDEETFLLTSESNCEDATKKLLERGVKVVVVTLGEEGCFILSNKGGIHVNGYRSNVIDTTGAGDSFWGAFLSKLVQHDSLDEISLEQFAEYGLFANATASLCVEKTGAIPAMPLLDSVLNRMK